MRRLMLLRHAKTESGAPSGRDEDRRLDERGVKDAAEIGDFIAHHPPFPDLVLVSPAVRARQTWELAWEAMQALAPPPTVEFVPELYCAEVVHLLHSVRIAAGLDPKQLLLVNHNPNKHKNTQAKTNDRKATTRQELARNMPTSGLAIIDVDTEAWD